MLHSHLLNSKINKQTKRFRLSPFTTQRNVIHPATLTTSAHRSNLYNKSCKIALDDTVTYGPLLFKTVNGVISDSDNANQLSNQLIETISATNVGNSLGVHTDDPTDGLWPCLLLLDHTQVVS